MGVKVAPQTHEWLWLHVIGFDGISSACPATAAITAPVAGDDTCIWRKTAVPMRNTGCEAATCLCRTFLCQLCEHTTYLVPHLPAAGLQPVQPLALVQAGARTARADL